MHIEDSQLNKFILDSNLISKVDLESAQKEAEKKGWSRDQLREEVRRR